jgi:hypothetical protein
MKKSTKTELEILVSIEDKMDRLLIVSALAGLEKQEKIRFLKSYKGKLSKRELESLTGIDRRGF